MLVVVRNHREKLGDVTSREGAELGRWLGVVSRAAVGSLREDLNRGGEEGDGEDVDVDVDVDVGDWNVVQNNGMVFYFLESTIMEKRVVHNEFEWLTHGGYL